MPCPLILAIESMTSGNLQMAEHADDLGYRLLILAEDCSIYSELDELDVVQFETRNYTSLRHYVSDRRDEIAAVFSPTDTWGIHAARLRDELGFTCRYSADELARFRDKQWVRQRLFQTVETPKSYPRILKPRRGTGSSDILFAESEEQLEQALYARERDDYVDEPFYQGPLYSAELYSDGSEVTFFGVTNRILTMPPIFLERVKTFPHAHGTEWERSVRQWSEDVLWSIGYNAGFAHLEFVETDHGFKLVELNARMPGALITPAIDECTNFNPYSMVIDDALGRGVDLPTEREISKGFSHVSLYADQTGILESVSGLNKLSNYPGSPTWVPSKEIGAAVTELGTYRSRIGNLYATADTPEIAQDRAIIASQMVEVTVR